MAILTIFTISMNFSNKKLEITPDKLKGSDWSESLTITSAEKV